MIRAPSNDCAYDSEVTMDLDKEEGHTSETHALQSCFTCIMHQYNEKGFTLTTITTHCKIIDFACFGTYENFTDMKTSSLPVKGFKV